jgi:hypothetical protein
MKNKIDPANKVMIQPAPPRQTLNIFGGPLSIKEYRQSFFILNKEYRFFFPPMISIVGIIEEDYKNIFDKNKININKMANAPMVRRKNPIKSSTNSLTNILLNKVSE